MSLKKTLVPLLLVVAILGAFVLPATSASAAPFAGVGQCAVNLPQWPTTAPQGAPDCVGIAVGAGVFGGSPTPCAGCEFRATVAQYSEPCVAGEPPLVGFANGRLSAGGNDVGGYNWIRVGLTAVLVPLAPGTTVGVAAFAPLPPLGTCANPLPLTANVIGVAVSPN